MMNFDDVMQRSSRKLDKNQMAAVVCDDQNCVVSAGAGSGKTTVLSYRFLRLVLEGKAHVNEILTLTFTRKAAAEMHERIHQQLLEYRDDPHIKHELTLFPEASIATLDSFCSRIVRSDCVRYGIAPGFVTDDEICRRLARSCIVDTIDANIGDPGLTLLCGLYSPERLVDELLVPYAMKAFIMSHPLAPDHAYETVQAELHKTMDSALSEFQDIYETIAQLSDWSTKTVSTASEACRQLVGKMPQLVAEEKWNDIKNLIHASTWRKPGKVTPDSDLDVLKQLTEPYKECSSKLCILCDNHVNQENLLEIFQFLGKCQDAFFLQKRKAGVLTFADISHMAIAILTDNKQLRSYFKKQFKYIMIDEFQDNNSLQKDLLFLLAETMDAEHEGIPSKDQLDTGKLFFVGDEKQSIYRFRNADVSVFKELKGELESIGGRSLELNTNYRSEPLLINHFNRLFASVMQNEGQKWEADFKPLGTRTPSERVNPTFTLCFKPLPDASQERDDEEEVAAANDSEAVHIASLIEQMLTTDDYLIPGGKGNTPRRPQPQDIAILMKSSGGQLGYEKALRNKGIAYVLQTSRALLLEAPANDLFNFLQLALYPQDSLAYVASLRSPFVRLSDQSILSLLDKDAYVDDEELLIGLHDDEKARYLQACDMYQRIVQMAGRSTIASMLSYLWYDCGYRNYLMSKRSYQPYLEHFDFLYALASQFDQRGDGLCTFLDYLRPRLGDSEKLSELDLMHEDVQGIQIMSIHKSKGLEFPIVIVPGMSSKGRMNRAPAFVEYQGIQVPDYLYTGGAANPCYYLDKDHDSELENAELKRLLYVAATRAETHLVFSGRKMSKNHCSDDNQSDLMSLFIHHSGLDLDALSDNQLGIGIRYIEDVPASALFAPSNLHTEFGQKAKWYESMVPRHIDVTSNQYAVTSLGEYVEYPDAVQVFAALQSDPLLREFSLSNVFGTYCHAVVEHLITSTDALSLDDLSKLFPDGKPDGVKDSEYHTILKEGRILAENFMGSELWKFLKGLGGSVECEVQFCCRMEHEGQEILATGSIDLLVRTESAIYVVDFKTDSARNSLMHEHQVRTYMQAMSRIYGVAVSGTVCYLRSPGQEQWWQQ